MRNKYPGPCYKCGKIVDAGSGYFERHSRSWRVQHVGCKNASPPNQSAPEYDHDDFDYFEGQMEDDWRERNGG